MKDHNPNRKNDQPFLAASRSPSHINTPNKIKKKIKPEKKGRLKSFTKRISNLPANFTVH
jgi:hypothetical protein